MKQQEVIERKIVECLVDSFLSVDTKISVHDGDLHTISKSTDVVEILDHVFYCQRNVTLVIRNLRGIKLGEVSITRGCGKPWEVISGYNWTTFGDGTMQIVMDRGPVAELIKEYVKQSKTPKE